MIRIIRTILGKCPDCGEPEHQTVDEQWQAHRCSNCGVDHTGDPCGMDDLSDHPDSLEL